MKFTAVCLGSFLFFAVLPARAQSPDAATAPSGIAKTADPPAGAPATAAAEKKKLKKVWTNDEIGSVKGNVSVVGDGNSSSVRTADKKVVPSGGAEEARQKQIEHYRDQMQEYQARIDAADKRIDQLKNFKGENTSPSGGINLNQGYNMVPVEDQVKQLEQEKKQLQAKIDDTENEARKNGIELGDLR